MNISSKEIRERFIEYFRGKKHMVIPSSSLVPRDDPTLLVINSGMAPLKSYFTAKEQPPAKRLCNIQKCVRTNDIESIGDRHHLTFFEMMGNWSIGDYFKEEAINFAWEAITDVFGFDVSNIYATFYGGDKNLPGVPPDNETKKIWQKIIPEKQIIPLDASCNFWGPAGKTGPCGPCTEIFVDRGKEYGCGKPDCGPDCQCGRFLEVWNAGVFMQYSMDENGGLTELPMKSVDAGAGLDRFAVILQQAESVYETDLMKPLVNILTRDNKLDPQSKSIRIMADHIRCAVFLIADGVQPSNTKINYVPRRMIRRAVLHAKLSGTDPNFLVIGAQETIRLFSPYYQSLEKSWTVIGKTIEREIGSFQNNLNRVLKELDRVIARSGGIISGEDAFKLHDTYGLSFELTKELAREKGFGVDEKEFKLRLEKQRDKSRRNAG